MDDMALLDQFMTLLPKALAKREGFLVQNLFIVLEFQPLPKQQWDINVYNRHGITTMTPARAQRVMDGLQVRLDQLGIQRAADGSLENRASK